MRIAITGSHLVGKTTLAEALGEVLPGHELLPEPYHLLEEDGYEFAEEPTLEDFELQLKQSLHCLGETGADAVFDRCPLDILGYLTTHQDAEAFDLEEWLPRVRESMSTLDLIVFVPVEEPDRVPVGRMQARLRADVDAALREIVVDDSYGLELEVITATGSTEARVKQVMKHLGR
jgi:hypothetical protein